MLELFVLLYRYDYCYWLDSYDYSYDYYNYSYYDYMPLASSPRHRSASTVDGIGAVQAALSIRRPR